MKIKLAQPTVSQHLKRTEKRRNYSREIDGKAICYCINPDTLKKWSILFLKFSGK